MDDLLNCCWHFCELLWHSSRKLIFFFRVQIFIQVQEGLQNDATLMSSAANNPGGSLAAEAERVRKLRERVEAQEAKLRKLRALRGQTDQQRITNGSLCNLA